MTIREFADTLKPMAWIAVYAKGTQIFSGNAEELVRTHYTYADQLVSEVRLPKNTNPRVREAIIVESGV